MSKTTAHPDGFLQAIKQALNEQMMAEAEPLIQKAVAEFERDMREKLAAKLIAQLDERYSIDRFGSELRITVRDAYKEL